MGQEGNCLRDLSFVCLVVVTKGSCVEPARGVGWFEASRSSSQASGGSPKSRNVGTIAITLRIIAIYIPSAKDVAGGYSNSRWRSKATQALRISPMRLGSMKYETRTCTRRALINLNPATIRSTRQPITSCEAKRASPPPTWAKKIVTTSNGEQVERREARSGEVNLRTRCNGERGATTTAELERHV
jgi:hypothetical protein